MNASGSLVYINPLDDSDPNTLKFLGSDILIDDEGHYVTKTMEITGNHW